MHHEEAGIAYERHLIEVAERDRLIDEWAGHEEPAPSGRIKIHAVPLAWQPHGGTPYGRAVLARQVEKVGMTEEPGRNNVLSRAAYLIGGFVAGGEIDRDRAVEALMRASEICGLPLREATTTIRSGLRKGMQKPIVAPR